MRTRAEPTLDLKLVLIVPRIRLRFGCQKVLTAWRVSNQTMRIRIKRITYQDERQSKVKARNKWPMARTITQIEKCSCYQVDVGRRVRRTWSVIMLSTYLATNVCLNSNLTYWALSSLQSGISSEFFFKIKIQTISNDCQLDYTQMESGMKLSPSPMKPTYLASKGLVRWR